jgi:hypothetical protein
MDRLLNQIEQYRGGKLMLTPGAFKVLQSLESVNSELEKYGLPNHLKYLTPQELKDPRKVDLILTRMGNKFELDHWQTKIDRPFGTLDLDHSPSENEKIAK